MPDLHCRTACRWADDQKLARNWLTVGCYGKVRGTDSGDISPSIVMVYPELRLLTASNVSGELLLHGMHLVKGAVRADMDSTHRL